MNNKLILIVNAPSSASVYGKLRGLTALEPPVWAGLIAQHIAQHTKFRVEILDAEAEGLDTQTTADTIISYDPLLTVFCIYGHQPSASTQCLPAANAVAEQLPRSLRSIAVGTHLSALPEQTLLECAFTYVCCGEGPTTVRRLAETLVHRFSVKKIPGLWYRDESGAACGNKPAANIPSAELDAALPGQAWWALDMKKYRAHNWHLWTGSPQDGYASVQTSLGCPFRCLRGDTKVNTIYGPIAIEKLARTRKTVPVYTYKDGQVVIADAINIKKLGVNERMVRVRFDDGSHIDCTPDHQFLAFTINTPTNGAFTETPTEAQHLKPGARIRAIRLYRDTYGRNIVEWRRSAKRNSHMVMEYVTGKPLAEGEIVHHKDRDPSNDWPGNLEICTREEHDEEHRQENSDRMKTANPMYSKDVARRVSRAVKDRIQQGTYIPFMSTEKGRAVIAEIARHRALTNNPMKDPKTAAKVGKATSERMKALWADRKTALAKLGRDVNHKVVSVKFLPKREDVYCLEVPGYGWFFANKVLVKNCSFCCINAPFGNSSIRYWSAGFVVEQIAHLVRVYGITNIKIPDEMFCLNPKRVKEICTGIIESGVANRLNMWAYARIDTVQDQQMLDLMRHAGFRWLGIGIESASAHVRHGVEKGKFGDGDIGSAINRVHLAGIHVAANYIFGLPDDTQESMRNTLDLACALNTEMANFYCAMAYPGSRLHALAREAGWALPESPGGPGWIGYSQHAYESLPLPTQTVSAEEVLDFRDKAWMAYFTRPEYHRMMEDTFGPAVLAEIRHMTAQGMPLRKHRELIT